MRDRAEELSSTWGRRGHELQLGLGVATGYATCGRVGFDGRYEYAAIGTVTNLAARLCGEAKPGRIPISHRSLKTVDDLVKAEGVGELSLRVTQCLANAKNKGFRRRKSGIP